MLNIFKSKWRLWCEELQQEKAKLSRTLRMALRELEQQKARAEILEQSLDATTNTLATARQMEKHHRERAERYKTERDRLQTKAEMLEELFRKAQCDGFCTICAEGKSLEDCGGVCNFRLIETGNPSTADAVPLPLTREALKEKE